MAFHCSHSLSGKHGFARGETRKDKLYICTFSKNFGEILKCVLKPGNKQDRNAIKVLSTKVKTIRHVPELLAK